jgi:hypothetical protein
MNEIKLSNEDVKTGLTSNAIKLIAIIAMTIDHIAKECINTKKEKEKLQ